MTRQKRELVRIVREPSGSINPDPSGRAAGRGAYICRTTDCLDLAIKKGALGRALKSPIPADLRERIAEILASEMTSTIEGGAHGQE
jgi:uncharacterized protein